MLNKKGAAGNMDKVSRAVLKCQKIMLYLAKEGYTKQVTKQKLREAIDWTVGIDDRTFQKYVNAMKRLKFIREVGNGVFELNYVKVPGAIEILVKRGDNQKKLM